MITSEILIDFIKNYKRDGKYTFYNDCIDKLKELKDMENIKKEAYILEPLRLYLLKNSEKYKIYLDTKKPTDKNFIKYEFEENEYDNFLELVLLTEEFDSNILKLKYDLFPEVIGAQERIKVENLKSKFPSPK